MIIFDFNQIVIANYMAQHYKNNSDNKGGDYVAAQMSGVNAITEEYMRHLVLNAIRSTLIKFRSQYGDNVIVACDHPHSWRKDVFPYYKASRGKTRESMDADWPFVHRVIDSLAEEIRDHFPYRVVRVDNAEADDIIGVATLNAIEPVLIVSRDKDFIQLHQFGVEQWDPIGDKYVSHPNPPHYLIEHTIRGDRGDGIPNFKTDDDVFVTPGARSKKIMSKNVDRWVTMTPEQICENETELRNWKRNEQLIDFRQIPPRIKNAILTELDTTQHSNRSKIFNYLAKNGLVKLMEQAEHF